MFEPTELERLAPAPRRSRPNVSGERRTLDPLAGTEAHRLRLPGQGRQAVAAVHHAGRLRRPDRRQGHAGRRDGARRLPDAGHAGPRMSIETFHKASLVHDDIEDDDAFRYGDETLHRQYGIGTAINVGDYLIGLGYRLVSREPKALGADVAADILDKLADAHLKLSEGQGAELLWRDAARQALDAARRAEDLRPEDGAGVRGGAVHRRPAGRAGRAVREADQATSARNLGVAFQILNDLKDWDGDEDNKLVGRQRRARRPADACCWPWPWKGCRRRSRKSCWRLSARDGQTPTRELAGSRLARVRELYERSRRVREGHPPDRQAPRAGRENRRRNSSPKSCARCSTT